MPNRILSRLAFAAVICTVASAALLLAGCTPQALIKGPCSPLPSPVVLKFKSTDPKLKHHGLPVAGHSATGQDTTVQWCQTDGTNNAIFTIDFHGDIPSTSAPTLTSDPNSYCTTPIPITVSAQNGNGFDVYKYTLTVNGKAIDPHIIVVGGN